MSAATNGGLERWLAAIDAGPTRFVVLRPRVDVVEVRDAHRQQTIGKVAYSAEFTPAINGEHVASEQSPDETVDEILSRADEALVT